VSGCLPGAKEAGVWGAFGEFGSKGYSTAAGHRGLQRGSNIYLFRGKGANGITYFDKQAQRIIDHYFQDALIAKPIFNHSTNRVVILLFYYTLSAQKHTNLLQLTSALGELFHKEIELILIRLHYPYLSSHILAKYIAINSMQYGLTKALRTLFKKVALALPHTPEGYTFGANSPFRLYDETPRKGGIQYLERALRRGGALERYKVSWCAPEGRHFHMKTYTDICIWGIRAISLDLGRYLR